MRSKEIKKKKVRNNPENTKVSEEGRGGGTPSTKEQIAPAACGEDHTRADNHTAAHGGPHARTGGYSLKGTAAHEKEPR